MRGHRVRAVSVLVLLACGGGSEPNDDGGNEPPPPPADASVVVVAGSVENPSEFQQFVALRLRNDGGPGVFKIEVWGYATSPGAGDTFMGESEPVEVEEDYEETVRYEVGTFTYPKYVFVFTRNQGSATYSQTSRFDFPPPQ